jgi:hypothetical protein
MAFISNFVISWFGTFIVFYIVGPKLEEDLLLFWMWCNYTHRCFNTELHLLWKHANLQLTIIFWREKKFQKASIPLIGQSKCYKYTRPYIENKGSIKISSIICSNVDVNHDCFGNNFCWNTSITFTIFI